MAIGKSKKQLLSIEKEFDIGEYTVIPMTNIVDINPAAEGEDINIVTTTMGSKRNYKDNYHTTVNFNIETYLTAETEIYDNGGTDEYYSNLDSLFLQGGMKRVQDGIGQTVVYTPDSDADNALSLNLYKENVKREIVGAKNSLTISGEVGKPVAITFNCSAYTALIPTIEASTDTAADLNELVVINKVSGYTEDGSTINMQSFTINMNAELQDTYAVGLSQYDLTDFDPQIEVTALKIANDISSWTSFEAGDLAEIVITGKSTSGIDVVITVPFAKILTNEEGDDAGRQTLVRNFRCQNGAGDDNLSIVINTIAS